MKSSGDRDEVLDRIRDTYAEYRAAGRQRLWDPRNPGYARMTRDRNAAVAELVAGATPHRGSVLDVGCGPGDLADLVRERRNDVRWTGMDLMADVIGEASRLRPYAQWVEGSADAMPFPAASFDVVVTATLFSSLPTVELEDDAAREVARVLRPGGTLVWYDLRYDNPRNRAVHGIGRARLARLFPAWAAELRTMTLLPPVARRLGRTTHVLYPLLEAVPIMRSHLMGRLVRPNA